MTSTQILLCSNNKHKINEYTAIARLHHISVKFLTLDMLSHTLDCPETGHSFLENALQKAHAYIEQNNANIVFPFLTEDSGICVDALAGAPGMYSARFGSDEGIATDKDRAMHLLDTMNQITYVSKRSAHYVSATILYYSKKQYIVAEEIWEGHLAFDYITGTTGFGYDPVFIPTGYKTPVSSITESEKHELSHRSRAFRRVMAGYEAL